MFFVEVPGTGIFGFNHDEGGSDLVGLTDAASKGIGQENLSQSWKCEVAGQSANEETGNGRISG